MPISSIGAYYNNRKDLESQLIFLKKLKNLQIKIINSLFNKIREISFIIKIVLNNKTSKANNIVNLHKKVIFYVII